MAIDAAALKALVEIELARVTDARVTAHVRCLLVEPTPIRREWEYGAAGQTYVCWNVLQHDRSSLSIAYCDIGFGPRCPWGLVVLEGDPNVLGMGMGMRMDSGWFEPFLQANFESLAVTELPIWRVFKSELSGRLLAISPEAAWDENSATSDAAS